MAQPKREIRLNLDTNFLKIIAIVSMVIDHAGKMFFAGTPYYGLMRIIGRLAFPIFCYCLTVGSLYTRSMPKYLLRVGIMAIVSQPIYVLALAHVSGAMTALSFAGNPVQAALEWYWLSLRTPNIMFSLFAGLLLIFTIQEKKYIATAVVAIAVWYLRSYLNYGLEGILLMLLFYAFCDRPLTSIVWVGGFMLWWGLSGSGYTFRSVRFGIQMFALLALPLIYIPMRTNIKLNKYVFYLFYPLHLLAIYLLDLVI